MDAVLELPSSQEIPSQAAHAVRTVAGRDGFDELAEPWRLLGSAAGGPIEQYEWAAACLATAPAAPDVRVVTIAQEERLVALAPLETKRLVGVPRRLMLGLDWHREPMDLLAADPLALKSLTRALARAGWPCVFGRLPAESLSVAALRVAFAGRAWIVERPQPPCPYIPLDASWETPEQHLNSGRRSDLRRAQRRAEKLGAVRAEIITPREADLDALLDEAFAVEARSWKGREGTAMACDPVESAFCREYAHAACRAGVLRLCCLRIGNQAVAMQVAMAQGGSFWLLKIGYDADFSPCSPGMLLLRDSIAYAARAGLKTFEFLGQAEPWIETWTQHHRPQLALRVYPYNLHGAAALAADATVLLANKTRSQTRQAAARARELAKAIVLPIVKRASRNYIAGETVADAQRVAQRLAAQGHSSTIGFWDTPEQSAREVADQYLAGLDALASDAPQAYLSIKLPSLRFSSELLGEVAAKAQALGRRIHFDAMAPETADRTRAAIDEVLAATPDAQIGVTLPGRWKRSLEDAGWAAQRKLYVRVVKGEWPDPLDPQRDLDRGYLETIDALAGRAAAVGVATHDPRLAAKSIGRLQSAGTPCDQELLYGLPMRSQIAQARRLNVHVRIYVPYGEAYMPYALSQVRRKPRIVWWLLRDLAASWLSVGQGAR